jgi:hypothetical protein
MHFFSFMKQFKGMELEHMFLLLHHDSKRSSWNRMCLKIKEIEVCLKIGKKYWEIYVCFWVECMFLFFA